MPPPVGGWRRVRSRRVTYGGAVSLFFLFVQFEFTHALGPHAARYIVDAHLAGDQTLSTGHEALDASNQKVAGVTRGIGVADVLVVGVVGAPASRPRLLRRARYVEQPPDPAEVPLSMVTFVKGTVPLRDKAQAHHRLHAIRLSHPPHNPFLH